MEPHPRVLSRDNSDKQKVLDIYGHLLDQAVNFGTHLFTWCVEVEPVTTPNVVISALLHQFVETLDGAAVLVRQAATEPMKLVLRSGLESVLGLTYILEADTDQRALCYWVADVQRRIRLYLRHDLATPQGKEYKAELATDPIGLASSDKIFQDTSEAVAALKHALKSKEKTRKINDEWNAARKKSNRIPHWYSLFDGPKNLRDLALKLSFSSWYRILYSNWSGTAHAEDALERFEVDVENKEARVRGIRHPGQLQVLTCVGANMAVAIYERIVRTRVPNHRADFSCWYKEIRETFREVCDQEEMIRVRTEPDAPK